MTSSRPSRTWRGSSCASAAAIPAQKPLAEFLAESDVPGIEGVDTRALTRHIREAGAMKAVLSTEDLDVESLIAKAKASPGLVGRDLVKEVTCAKGHRIRAPRMRDHSTAGDGDR